MCKICTECKDSFELSKFQKDASSKDGKQSRCKVCQNKLNTIWRESHRIEHRAMNKRYHEKNKEKINAKIKECYLRNIDGNRLRNKENIKLKRLNMSTEERETVNAKKKAYRELNRNKIKAYKKQYNLEKPHVKRTAAKMRKMSKKKRTPAWADLDKIREVYKNCPVGMQVDHIIPLHGKTVSGLHVHGNLQYLAPLDNVRKSNKW